jgi:hypothetical protein
MLIRNLDFACVDLDQELTCTYLMLTVNLNVTCLDLELTLIDLCACFLFVLLLLVLLREGRHDGYELQDHRQAVGHRADGGTCTAVRSADGPYT